VLHQIFLLLSLEDLSLIAFYGKGIILQQALLFFQPRPLRGCKNKSKDLSNSGAAFRRPSDVYAFISSRRDTQMSKRAFGRIQFGKRSQRNQNGRGRAEMKTHNRLNCASGAARAPSTRERGLKIDSGAPSKGGWVGDCGRQLQKCKIAI